MTYTPVDIATLKAPDVLQTYCESVLGQGKRIGGKMFYPCPYGAHTRLKLEVTDKNGCGLALCRACNRGGSVFDVAAGVLGVDPRKDFAACVEAVADAVGYNLTPDDGTAPKKGRRSRKAGFSRPLAAPARPAPAPAVEKPLEYLSPDMEREALAMVERLRNAPEQMAVYAASLGVPLSILRSHTDIANCAGRGLLGLDERGRLVYVYTHCPDEGAPVRVLGVKTRNPQGVHPRFLMTGSKQAPWGMDGAEPYGDIFVTEGESDALAVRAALESWLDIWLHLSPDDYPEPADLPAVIAKPDAGTFRDVWARRLIGKDVTLITDADEAGQKGAANSAETLRAAGVRRVFTWAPPAGCKDARATLDAARPWLLADNLMQTRKDFTSNYHE